MASKPASLLQKEQAVLQKLGLNPEKSQALVQELHTHPEEQIESILDDLDNIAAGRMVLHDAAKIIFESMGNFKSEVDAIKTKSKEVANLASSSSAEIHHLYDTYIAGLKDRFPNIKQKLNNIETLTIPVHDKAGKLLGFVSRSFVPSGINPEKFHAIVDQMSKLRPKLQTMAGKVGNAEDVATATVGLMDELIALQKEAKSKTERITPTYVERNSSVVAAETAVMESPVSQEVATDTAEVEHLFSAMAPLVDRAEENIDTLLAMVNDLEKDFNTLGGE